MHVKLGPALRFARTVLLLSLALIACEGDPHSLTWGFTFATPELRARAVVIEAQIRQGGCDGAVMYDEELRVSGGMAPAPARLEKGTYGLVGRARDASCAVFAAGCVPVTLPEQADRTVQVPLSAIVEEAGCPAGCSDGRCIGGTDAGSSDGGGGDSGGVDSGGLDAGPIDGGPVDSGPIDTGVDAGPDYREDPLNCGAAGVRCDADEYCSGSTCRCRPGLTRVGMLCTDLETDPNNCGAPGVVCMDGTMVTCRSGTCEDACTTGQTNCMNACIDTMRDPRHCGACGNACRVDEICEGGSCSRYASTSCDSCPCARCSTLAWDCGTYGGNVVCTD